MDYPWYTTLEAHSDELQQGDLIPECPIVIPPSNLLEGESTDVTINLIDSIILSQSCDLENNKIDIALVCPYHSLKYHLSKQSDQNKKNLLRVIDSLKKGFLPGYHLINKSEIDSIAEDFLVVDFKNIYGIQIKALREVASKIKPRSRLLPPYREHLSQAFARYFMRVGLPQDIEIPNTYI